MDYFPRKSLSKYLITDTIDFNKHVHDIDIFINVKMTSGENTRAATQGDFSKLQGDLNFTFDQRESDVNLHKATSSPSIVSPDATYKQVFCVHLYPVMLYLVSNILYLSLVIVYIEGTRNDIIIKPPRYN